MSRFTRYATTSQTLSLVAMEEASRRGLREADLADLLLALTLSDQPAGRVLRELGITIDAGRAAVEAYHKGQIASLGITTSLPPAGNIVFHETGGYEWSKRALDVIRSAGRKGRTADATAVLRELLDEPSGVVTDLLVQLDTTPTKVLAGLDSIPAAAAKRTSPPHRRGELRGVSEAFVPAPVQSVWALLSLPGRVPEWEPSIEAVETSDTSTTHQVPTTHSTPTTEDAGQANDKPEVGGTWIAHARTTHPNGKPLKVHDKFRRRALELLQAAPQARIVWRFSYPDATTSPSVITSFDLTAITGGTQLTITMTLARLPGRRALLSLALLPVRRFLVWIRLNQISGSISRTFRQTRTPRDSTDRM
jgi:hypothetical protein